MENQAWENRFETTANENAKLRSENDLLHTTVLDLQHRLLQQSAVQSQTTQGDAKIEQLGKVGSDLVGLLRHGIEVLAGGQMARLQPLMNDPHISALLERDPEDLKRYARVIQENEELFASLMDASELLTALQNPDVLNLLQDPRVGHFLQQRQNLMWIASIVSMQYENPTPEVRQAAQDDGTDEADSRPETTEEDPACDAEKGSEACSKETPEKERSAGVAGMGIHSKEAMEVNPEDEEAAPSFGERTTPSEVNHEEAVPSSKTERSGSTPSERTTPSNGHEPGSSNEDLSPEVIQLARKLNRLPGVVQTLQHPAVAMAMEHPHLQALLNDPGFQQRIMMQIGGLDELSGLLQSESTSDLESDDPSSETGT